MFVELLASAGNIWSIQNCGDHTDAARPGFENGIDIFQRDAADGKPWTDHIRGGPADVVERDARSPRLCWRGENRADGEIVGIGFHRPDSLFGGVGAEAKGRLMTRRLPLLVRLKVIFLTEMADFSAQVAGELPVVIDDKGDTSSARDGKQRFGRLSDFFFRPVFGPMLDEVGTAIAELLGEVCRGAAVQIRAIDKGVETAIGEEFHVMHQF